MQLIYFHIKFEIPKQVRNDTLFIVMLNSFQHLIFCVCISTHSILKPPGLIKMISTPLLLLPAPDSPDLFLLLGRNI